MTTTTKTKRSYRWVCPTCGKGANLGPQPRKDDPRRYCLPCSATASRMIERVCPKLEAKRAAKADSRKAAQKRKRQTAARKRTRQEPADFAALRKRANRYGREGFNIEKEADRLWTLLAPYHRGAPRPKIEISWMRVKIDRNPWTNEPMLWFSGRHSGFAYTRSGYIRLRAGTEWHTLAHELVHMAVGVRYANGRHTAHDEVFYRCLKDLCERRWKIEISFYGVPPWGYAVDHFIQLQMDKKGAIRFGKKKIEEVAA